MSSNLPNNPSNETFEKLNDDTTNLLINSKALKLCYQSKAIRDVIFENIEEPEVKE